MSNPPPAFQLDPPPAGFKLDGPRPRPVGKVKLDPYNPGDDVQDVGTAYTTTGKVVDGDTIKVSPFLSARLSGFDAFERGQPGYRPGTGQRLDLGALSTSALTPYIRPSQPAYGTGAFTYGRPVVTLGQGQNDPVPSLLRQGAGYAAPEYLSADPERAAAYMESERLGRMNLRGGFGANHIRPDAYRRPLTERTVKLAPDEYLAFDDQIPQDTPKLKRLTPEQEKRNAAYIASNVGNPNFNLPEYQRFFREELGVTDLQPNSPEYVEAVRKGGKIDYGIDYSTLDGESQQELKELIAFSGMRPEVAQEYRDLLNKGDTAGALAYGKKNGMDFDPADIQRYIDARKKGEQGTIPLPLIDPGEGRFGLGGRGASGAFQRGVIDPVSLLDEMGAVPDTLAPSWLQSAVGGPEYRENVWNSDRSFGDIWSNNARQNRGISGYDEKYHPIARTSGQIVGGIALPYGGGLRGALNFAKIGGIEGGINAFGAADGSVTDRLKAVPGGVAIGGTLGLAFGKGEELLRPLIKQGVSKVTGGRMFPDMAPARVVSDVPAPRTIDRLDIPPTDGPLPLPALGERVPSANPGPVIGQPPKLGDVLPKIQEWAKSQAPGTMFHGSPRAGITEFDPYGRADYGLFGQGTYLTDNPSVAAGYTGKGVKAAGGSEGRTIYGVNQNVRNPLDMDAPADLGLWEKAAGQYTDQFRPGMTNAEAFREVEDAIRQEGLPKWEGAEMMNDVIRGMGHDGVTHIGGGRYGRGDGPRHKVVIALDPEQTQITGSLSVGDLMRAPQRERSWIDIQAQDAPPQGFVLDPPQGRANMDAEGLPSLSSPALGPQPVRPRSMLDPATDAMLRANVERVQPGDVLPRASNEVQSLDEAMRINQGLYPELRAPNERDALTSRPFPSRANPDNMLNRKGPLDLAAYVRSQGGVADFRGELKAAGLSNAPRKGDDFTGGENRLGPLLNDDSGATLDDMAQRAWEAGYFPDHATRPTVDEFVTALGDTYRGVNRTFRPDDFNEIDAFNAARDQRLAVERARQEGAPLADDMGQPATYDDILANSPPASAYEDWRSAVQKRVGNINIERLNSPTEISQAMKVANDIGDGFDAARRGRMSFEETARLAEELGMTADDLVARRKGQAFNAEEAAAARALNRKASIELVNMAQRFRRNGGEVGAEDMAKFRAALLRKAAIQEQVSGMTAEAGRLLSQFRMAADSVDVPGHVLRELASGPGGAKRLNEIADGILEFEKDPRKLNQFVQRAMKPKFSDMLVELMYNFRLSGPQTHGVNILSNTMTALGQLPEHMGGVAVGAIRRGVFRNKAERALMSDVGQRAIGMMEGTWEGLIAARQGWKTGEAADFVGKVESNIQKAIPNWAGGEFIRMPTRALTAEDEFFKAIARRGQLRMMAAAQARKEGLKGQEFLDRKNELVDNPPDEMLSEALDFARYVTFQKELGPIASRISAITNDYPALKIIVPFVRTPSNLIKFAFERSPAAPLLKEWRDQVRRGGQDADLAISRMLMGSGVGMIVAQLAQEGKITGSLPKDETKANVLLAQGWKPYSIKIGDQWVSYSRLDPFSTTIGSAADMATLGDGLSDKQLDDQAMIITASIVNNLASKTWLSGVSDMLQAARDPERYGAQFIRNQVAGLVVPAAVSQTARTMDPVRRETPTIGATIQSRIPGLSDNLLPKRDLWGKEIANEDAPGPDIISPLWTSTQRPDAIGDEILRVGATATKPSRMVGKGELTDKQYDDLQRLAGPTRRRYLDVLLNSETYKQADVETQRELIRKAMGAGRAAAKDNVLSGAPIPMLQGDVKRSRRSAPVAPDGFVLDPPPAGFVLDR